MPARKTLPKGALAVRTYEKLETYAEKFAEGHFGLLILIGRAGLAKSQIMKRALGKRALTIEGSASAWGMYQALWESRGQLVLIDDVDEIYKDQASVRLLKCLCQTDPTKTVAWYTGATDQSGIPKQFETTSKVCIIANEWKELSKNISAVQSRGHLLSFEPSPEEVHRQVATWFWDKEIFAWVGEHLPQLPGIDMRDYIKAVELKEAGMEWHDAFIRLLHEKTLLVARLVADESFPDDKARIEAFREAGGGSRATYFNHKKKLGVKKRGIQQLDIPLTSPRRRRPKPKAVPKLRVVGG